MTKKLTNAMRSSVRRGQASLVNIPCSLTSTGQMQGGEQSGTVAALVCLDLSAKWVRVDGAGRVQRVDRRFVDRGAALAVIGSRRLTEAEGGRRRLAGRGSDGRPVHSRKSRSSENMLYSVHTLQAGSIPTIGS